MIDFIEYIVSELKSKRLSQVNALSLIKQFSSRTSTQGDALFIHPLLHKNTSDLNQQSYSSTFSGKEFFLNDHQVDVNGIGRCKVLPGVVYLEMAREALVHALPIENESFAVELSNVVWLKPILKPVKELSRLSEVYIALYVEDNQVNNFNEYEDDYLSFDIFSHENQQEVIHCQGQVRFIPSSPKEKVDTQNLRDKMTRGVLEQDTIYKAFSSIGLHYGQSHQGLKTIAQGEGELLAEVCLPSVLEDEKKNYYLNPCLMDSVLQSVIGLTEDISVLPDNPSLPFALEQMIVLAACTPKMNVWVRPALGQPSNLKSNQTSLKQVSNSDGTSNKLASNKITNNKLTKLDIDCFDQEGNLCVQLKGFTSREIPNSVASDALKKLANNRSVEQFAARPNWVEKALSYPEVNPKNKPFKERHILVFGFDESELSELKKAIKTDSITDISKKDLTNEPSQFSAIALQCFKVICSIFESKPKGNILLQLVSKKNSGSELLLGLSGLLKSAQLENPLFSSQIIFVEDKLSPNSVASIIHENATQVDDSVIRYNGHQRSILNWVLSPFMYEAQSLEKEGYPSIKDNGIYLITGGLGGLGVVFTQEILSITEQAKVIVTGREVLSDEQWEKKKHALFSTMAQSEHWQALSQRIIYRPMDLESRHDVENVIGSVVKKFNGLNGIIHSAGMTRDNYLIKKSDQEFIEVLNPKVNGTIYLDLASRHLDLDLFVLFSSGVSIMGNPGQADYAVANGFLDQFSKIRNEKVLSGQRKGVTVSMNWPLWADGGMQISPQQAKEYQALTGMIPMTTKTGINAFHHALFEQSSQLFVMEGDADKIRSLFEVTASSESSRFASNIDLENDISLLDNNEDEPVFKPIQTDRPNLSDQTRNFLKREFSAILKLPAEQIDPLSSLDMYGIDSIVAMNLTSQLEKTFGKLSKTLFFEYQTINELTDYFVESFSATLDSLFEDQTAKYSKASQSRNESTAQKGQSKNGVADNSNTKIDVKHKVVANRSRRLKRRTVDTEVHLKTSANDPIAIVGLSGKFPESPDLEAYWWNLSQGKDCVTEVPKSRWDWKDFYSDNRSDVGKHFSKWGGFIEGVDEFDPKFFNISPREAAYIDPQERLFLQYAWMAIEDAGYTRESLQIKHENLQPGQVGIYVGVMYGEYNMSGSLASIANRVSYVLNVHGPSMTVDTMCSSSLTAIHLACQDLKLGRTDLAIAGGVNVSVHPNKYSMLSAGQFISSDGHCQSFGEGGDGYIPGEGVGAIILKRLSEAEEDGNVIHGVIKGSALNHGGKTNGYTVPNPQSQTSAIVEALSLANVDARQVNYIEAHGTGTKLGDPIEITALTKAFNANAKKANLTGQQKSTCLIGSAKSNIGHCESAAGIAGVAKVLLQIKHKKIAPSLHSSKLNPNIDFEKTPFVVNQTLVDWEKPVVDGIEYPRIAGISSFGAGGSNAHVLIEEYLPKQSVQGQSIQSQTILQHPIVIPVSAKTLAQLQQKIEQLLQLLKASRNSISLISMAYTLQLGREAMDERAAFVVSNEGELIESLECYLDKTSVFGKIYTGSLKDHKETVALFSTDEDLQDTVSKWLENRKSAKLAEVWVKGVSLNWLTLYKSANLSTSSLSTTGQPPKMLSLPTYPFAKEKYWIDITEKTLFNYTGNPKTRPSLSLVKNRISPLVQSNASDIYQSSYYSEFNGDEFFIKDNAIQSQGYLSAFTQLEMVTSAIKHNLSMSDSFVPFELSSIQWSEPQFFSKTDELNSQPNKSIVAIFNAHNQTSLTHDLSNLEFDFYSESPSEDIVHCQGSYQLLASNAINTVKKIDWIGLKAKVNGKLLQKKKVYSLLECSNHTYVESFQCVDNLWVNNDDVIAEIKLPDYQPKNDGSFEEFTLAPAIVNGVLQTAILLQVREQEQKQGSHSKGIWLPVLLQGLKLFKALPKQIMVWARRTRNDGIDDSVEYLDIDLFDVNGNLCAQFHQLTLKLISLGSLNVTHSTASDVATATQSIAPTIVYNDVVQGKPDAIELLGKKDDRLSQSLVSIDAKPHKIQLMSTKTTSSDHRMNTNEALIDEQSVSSRSNNVNVNNRRTYNSESNKAQGDFFVNENNSENKRSIPKPETTQYSKEQLQNELITSLSKALYLSAEDIEIDKSFIDLGLDSIVGVEWINVINKQYGLTISATKVYDYSNISELSAFLLSELNVMNKKKGQDTLSPVISEVLLEKELSQSATSIQFNPITEVNNAVKDTSPITAADKRTPSNHNYDSIESFLLESLSQALYLSVSDIELDRSFIDLGLDSIVGVEWINVINKHYGTTISATKVYDYSNVKELSFFLTKELGEGSFEQASLDAPVNTLIKESNRSVKSAALNQTELASSNLTQHHSKSDLIEAPLSNNIEKVNQASESNEHTSQFSSVNVFPHNVFPVLRKRILQREKQRQFRQESTISVHEKIAIIGMSGRYPDASNLNQYWENLVIGKNSITEISKSRWSTDSFYDPEPGKPGKIYCKWLGALDDVDCFDPLFFQISPSEAEIMDPQHRLFMQESYRAFEDAGYSNRSLSNKKCGVYLGIMSSEYSFLLSKSNSTQVETTGNSFAIGAARIAYYLNLKGPAIPIDTACSSSLVAIHLATQALQNREIDMALAGGVSLYLIPESYLGMCRAGMLSKDGQCKTFDDSANGFVPGEGVGAVVLKRLSDAEKDHDNIHGVILGSAINQDGKTNGITAPSVNSQIELERDFYNRFNIEPESISYVEAHGTGTKLGDPIELEALSTVFAEKTERKQFCALGSVKTNIGHTSGAAGVASVQKVLLSMRHKTIVPSLNINKENSLFDLNNSPFYISRNSSQWHVENDNPRRASVSSFGFSGTNAHLVIEEYRSLNQSREKSELNNNNEFAFPFSARTETQLREKIENFIHFLQGEGEQSLESMAYTLQLGREAMKVRFATFSNSKSDLINGLEEFLVGGSVTKTSFFGQVGKDKKDIERFGSDTTLKKDVEIWTNNKTFNKLLEFWVKGYEIQWKDLYSDRLPFKASLPTYPFAKERYWVDVDVNDISRHDSGNESNLNRVDNVHLNASFSSMSTGLALTEKPLEQSESNATLYAHPKWVHSSWLNDICFSHQSSLASNTLNARLSEKIVGSFSKKRVMIFGSASELFNLMQEKIATLKVGAEHLVFVTFGEQYEEISPTHFFIDPSNSEHFTKLLQQLKTYNNYPTDVVHQNIESHRNSDDGQTSTLDDLIANSLFALVGLAKAMLSIASQSAVNFISLSTMTEEGQRTAFSSGHLQNALAAFYKTLKQENSKFTGRTVRLLSSYFNQPKVLNTILSDIVLSEITYSSDAIEEVMYSSSSLISKDDAEQKYIRRVKKIATFEPEQHIDQQVALKEKGVYLITGGLGGLGYLFSDYLAKSYQAHLVILGRSILTDALQNKLNQLKAFASSVTYKQTDVNDFDEVDRIIKEIKITHSSLQGIFHSAGVNRDARIIKKDVSDLALVCGAKIKGTINLDLATKNEILDCFVLFSSGAGLFGNVGQCDYAFANQFMDEFAGARQHDVAHGYRSGKSLSINWPFWLSGGMSVSEDILAITEKKTGLLPLSSEIGLSYFEGFLMSSAAQGIPLYGKASKILNYIGETDPVVLDAFINTHDIELNDEVKQNVIEYLKSLVSEETKIHIDAIDSDERFEAYGFDSMMIGRFNANLERDLGELPKTLLYEYESIDELSEYLIKEQQNAVYGLFSASPTTHLNNPSLTNDPQSVELQQAVFNQELNGNGRAAKKNEIVRSEPERSELVKDKEIAIIGVHGCYPQSENLNDYWKNLTLSRDLIETVPENRWLIDDYFDADPENAKLGKIYCKWGGFLRDFDKFDPMFFNLSQEEANSIDPQERLFLQSVWATIEDSGYTPESLRHQYSKYKSANVGVFVGVTTNSYETLTPEEWSRGNIVSPSGKPWSIANRVSYFFDFKGPSQPIDTACSSSLVAIHLACESILRGECQLAIAGGVNIYSHPSKFQSFCKKRMVSSSGKNCSFGAGDDGFVPGEGVGSVLLKSLADAKKDNDHIYAVIKGSAYEHSGRSNGYSAPNPNSQANLISETLKKSNVKAESIRYVEGHGTGTQLGDSLEVLSLTQAFSRETSQKQYCSLGSVKANIGHAESAAGIAGVHKILWQLKHKQLAPSLHSDEINPNIDFSGTPFYLQHELSQWESDSTNPRRAMINSFGAGGVNACLILEEHVAESNLQLMDGTVSNILNESASDGDLIESDKTKEKLSEELMLVPLSAKDIMRLQQKVRSLSTYLKELPDSYPNYTINNIAYTLQVGRESMEQRLAILAFDRDDLIAKLDLWLSENKNESESVSHRSQMIFSGCVEGRVKTKHKDKVNDAIIVAQLIENRELEKLAQIWATQKNVDWTNYYRAANSASKSKLPLARLPLPSYPFQKLRCWLSESRVAQEKITLKQFSTTLDVGLHPLVTRNSSTLNAIRFSSTLRNDQYYSTEHQVNNQKIFPGSGFLEMACFSASIAGEQKVSRLKDIFWVNPIAFQDGTVNAETLFKVQNESTLFEVTSLNQDREQVLHAEGRIVFEDSASLSDDIPEKLSVTNLIENANKRLDTKALYETFQSFGFGYGNAFQTIKEFYINESYALTKLSLPDHLVSEFERYILHPSLIDGALQTVVGLIGIVEPGTPYLPFALDEVELIQPLSKDCYALVEFANSDDHFQSDIKTFNIHMINSHGDILVRLKNFYVRALRQNSSELESKRHQSDKDHVDA